MKFLYQVSQLAFTMLPKKIQRKLRNNMFQEDIFLTHKLEFSNGELIKCHQPTYNDIKITGNCFKAIFTMHNAIQVLLTLLVIVGVDIHEDLQYAIIIYTTIAYVFISNVFIIVLVLWVNSIKYTQQCEINNRHCMIFSTIKAIIQEQQVNKQQLASFQQIKWGQLQAGQIVCLQRGEQSPADLLILDSASDYLKINYENRHPCVATCIPQYSDQKGQIIDFKINLNGIIQYTIQDNSIEGTLKLKKDPKATKFDQNNIIYRGEQFTSSDWIYAMALQVGKGCVRAQTKEISNKLNTSFMFNPTFHQLLLFLVGLIAFLIPKLVQNSTTTYQENIAACLLIFPFNILTSKVILQTYEHFRLLKLFNSQLILKQKQIEKTKADPKQQDLMQFHEDQGQNVQLIISKSNQQNIQKQQQLQQQQSQLHNKLIQFKDHTLDFNGAQILTDQSILDLFNTDLVVINNPETIFMTDRQVQVIVIESIKYVFDLSRIYDKMPNMYETLQTNGDKLLIDTHKCHQSEEMMNIDLGALLELKKTPQLVDDASRSYTPMLTGKLKPTTYLEDVTKVKKLNLDSQKQHQFVSFKKASSRNLFAIHSPNQNSSGGENSPKLFVKQKSSRFFKSYPSKPQLGLSIGNAESQKQISHVQFDESDFFNRLANNDDLIVNEVMLMLLVCNDVTTTFDLEKQQVSFDYGNQYDKSILEFGEQFQYKLHHSSYQENVRPDYVLDTISNRVISIANKVKVVEVLFTFKPSNDRPDILSVLMRDPESFLLEEGAILYTRYEYNQKSINQIPEEIREKLITQQQANSIDHLSELLLQGVKVFFYTKVQINYQDTQTLLQQISKGHENYKDEEHSHHPQLKFEKLAEVVTLIGIKQNIKDTILTLDKPEIGIVEKFKKAHFFRTLRELKIKPCILTCEGFDELMQMLACSNLIQSQDRVLIFKETELQPLRYKMKQHIQYMLEHQQILERPRQELSKYLIVNKEALQLILSDEYLRYHLILSIKFSNGVAGFGLSSRNKGKLLKLIRQSVKYITCIGSSIDCQYLYKYSDYSISLYKQDCQVALSQPKLQIHSITQFLKLLCLYCPHKKMLTINLTQFIIYRNLLIAIVYYALIQSQLLIELSNMLIFYLVVNNILTFILYFQLLTYNTNSQIENVQLQFINFDTLRRHNILIKTAQTTLIAYFDIVLIILGAYINNVIQNSDKGNTQIESISIFVNMELIEKLTIVLKLYGSNQVAKEQQWKLIIYAFFQFLVILLLQIAQSNYEYSTLKDQFTSAGIIGWIIIIIWIMGIKYTIQQILDCWNIKIECDYIERNQIPKNINELQFNSIEMIKKVSSTYPNNQVVLSIFKDKELIDDQIIKKVSNCNDNKLEFRMEGKLTFSDEITEKEYQQYMRQSHQFNYQTYTFIVYDIIMGIIVIYFSYEQLSNAGIISIITIQMVVQSFLTLCYLTSKTKSRKKYYQTVSFFFRFITKVISDALYYYLIQDNLIVVVSVSFILVQGIARISSLGFSTYILILVLERLSNIIMSTIYRNGGNSIIWFQVIEETLILLVITIAINLIVYKIEYLSRYSFILSNQLEKAQRTMNDVLGLLMPRFIKERMTKGQISISEDQGEVTLLFCDICDFDNIIQAEQENIVQFLDYLFRQFDKLCKHNEVQKIETVGKTYMAAAGLKDYQNELTQTAGNSTQRILNTAIGMMEAAKLLKYGDNKELTIKVGIHYGRVIAGVIGSHKPQFSLIGDTVNTTSRVCSTGQNGSIILSEQAYQRVSQLKYQFSQTRVQAKGKGTLLTFVLIQIKKKLDYSNILGHENMPLVRPQQSSSNQLKLLKETNQISQSQELGNKQDTKQRPSLSKQPSLECPIIKQCELENLKQSSKQPSSNFHDSQSLSQKKQKSNQMILIDLAPEGGGMKKLKCQQSQDQQIELIISPDQHQNKFGKIEDFKKILNKHPNVEGQTFNRQGTRKLTKQFTQNENDPITPRGKSKYKFQVQKSDRFDCDKINPETPINKSKDEQFECFQCHKKQNVLGLQSPLNPERINSLLKYQVDAFQRIEQPEVEIIDLQQSEAEFNQIYDVYKDFKYVQPKYTIILLTFFEIAYLLSYFIIIDQMLEFQIDLYISIGCQIFCTIILAIGITIQSNSQQAEYSIVLVVIYFVMQLSLNLLYNFYFNQFEYIVILSLIQSSALLMNLIYLQYLNKRDVIKVYLAFGVYLIITLVMSSLYVVIILYSISILTCIYLFKNYISTLYIKNYQLNKQLEIQNLAQENILQHLLPAHILSRFISDQTSTENYTDFFGDATILFADIAGFTKYSGSVEPEQVVNMLRSLFINFDQHCLALKVYKLYTIGDCYVAIGVIDANNRNPVEEAANIVLFGLKMIEIIEQIKKNPEFQHLNMRIGIHTGDIIGGVVGTDVVRYDIYGENVTIANKMESNGCEGRIMVSETTKTMLEDEFDDMFVFENGKGVYIPSSDQTIQGYYTEINQSIYE